ncbi:hypothetical protein LguiA_026674 [Lonicera macranthoides]
MEELYRLQSSNISYSDDIIVGVSNFTPPITGSEIPDLIKVQIATHPLFPNLVSAYVECRKVGAPPEMSSLLEEISKEIHPIGTRSEIGADPELDEFMESYCEILHRYKEEVSKTFDEATAFLTGVESQLNNLCKETMRSSTASLISSGNYHSDEVAGTSEEDVSCGEMEHGQSQESPGACTGDQELKEMLLRKYSGYLGSLKKDLLKKRKKGKLPKDARNALLDWWNTHYRWPYPTEEDKAKLAEVTGLDQKQINNWFINQRKRHWRPSEDMRYALMEGVGGGSSSSFQGPVYFDAAAGTGSNTVDI